MSCWKKQLGIIIFCLCSLPAYAQSLLLAPEQLKNNLTNDAVIILDARSTNLYEQDHIPGARNFPVNWTYEHKSINGKITSPNQIQMILRQLSLDREMPIVIYDEGALVDAARLFWTLEVYGFTQVKVLNRGYDYWAAQNYPTSDDTPKITPSDYVPVINHKRLATKFSTQTATQNPNQIVIDARPEQAYLGLKSHAKRFGHIPSAINIPASHNIDSTNHFAQISSVTHLKNVYFNIPKNKKVVLYCAIGRISATNYLALRELGYDVANYDASWLEWGNDFSLPIVTSSQAQMKP
ncbi:sulfurtransferase [Hydrogenovibrio sp. 3SP14C1]|uniref:sulfurtransferase n=1 Tax=Hydrogenovibrio sp. 3SP14C1 TaxID=3038774 RepID=UPI00241658DD|nr:sulfurtransferase [Hydrogenovibrio sp. 3SP14C1]MDG4811480.1 sulfurtransferase [Hydrogenovibrio sp. 3SP14C1]